MATQHGARYQMKDLRQRTPHYLAQHNNHAQCAAILEAHRARRVAELQARAESPSSLRSAE